MHVHHPKDLQCSFSKINRTPFTRSTFTPRSIFLHALVIVLLTIGCSSGNDEPKDEHVRVAIDSTEVNPTDTLHSIQGNLALSQILTYPENVVLTGLPQHRLVTVYKLVEKPSRPDPVYNTYSYYEEPESERHVHFMPGIDLIYGYNLLNIAHYDLATEKLNYLFDHPVLVKSLYYPSFIQDSLHKKPINRDYYIVSAYDADTNLDTLINRRDLRRIYTFNASCSERKPLVPANYSVVRSQYDSANDLMYIFARHDANKNGVIDKKEPLHVFWVNLKLPAEGKRLY